MKLKQTVVVISLLCSSAYAETIDVSSFYADDDGMSVRKNQVSAQFNSGLGIGAARTTYASQLEKVSSNSIFATADISLAGFSISGFKGIAQTGKKTFAVGDTSIRYSISRFVSAEVNMFSDLLVNNASAAQTTMYGATTSIEAATEKFGIGVAARNIRYSDGNNQNGHLFRAWYQPVEGVVVFAKSKNYANTKFSSDYFSPSEYERSGVGISLRRKIGDTRLALNAETAEIRTPGNIEKAIAWKLQSETKISNNARANVVVGRDFGLAGGFEYKFAEVKVSVTF